MSRRLIRAFLFVLILFTLNIAAQPARAESPERRAALKLCRQRYRDTTRGTKRLKGPDKRARIEAAREELRRCRALAPNR
jgi:hypothetical protein